MELLLLLSSWLDTIWSTVVFPVLESAGAVTNDGSVATTMTLLVANTKTQTSREAIYLSVGVFLGWLLIGPVFSFVLRTLIQPLFLLAMRLCIRRRRRGIGGWCYGNASASLRRELVLVTAADRVFAAGDGTDKAKYELKKCSHDMGFHQRASPDIVVYPLTPEEVASIVRICAAQCVPVVARGAGSGLEGGAIPYQGGVVLNLMKMKRMELREKDMQVVVGPGVKKADLNAYLEPHGLLFGPDPASNPSVGGMASTRGSGLSTMLYGTTGENVISLVVVSPQGKLIRTRQCVRKSSTGLDLTALYVGAEGTLGIIVELVFRVHPIPRVRCGALAAFPDVGTAAQTVARAVRSGIATICRCELLNADGIRATNKKYETNLQAVPTVFLEFRAESVAACERDSQRVQDMAEGEGAISYEFTADGKEMDRLWAARRGCYLASIAYRNSCGGGPEEVSEGKKKKKKKSDSVYLSDTCVPFSKLSDMITETEKDFEKVGLPAIICAHIADGNFHCCIPYQPEEKAQVVAAERRLIARAIEVGGTVSGEHGVGVGKIPHIVDEHGHDTMDIMRRIKRALDPDCIMNPQKQFMTGLEGCPVPAIPAVYSATDAIEKSYAW